MVINVIHEVKISMKLRNRFPTQIAFPGWGRTTPASRALALVIGGRRLLWLKKMMRVNSATFFNLIRGCQCIRRSVSVSSKSVDVFKEMSVYSYPFNIFECNFQRILSSFCLLLCIVNQRMRLSLDKIASMCLYVRLVPLW